MGLFLDTAIALVTTFSLYSVLSSTIQEYIAKLLNLRGRMLHEAMMRLFGRERSTRFPAGQERQFQSRLAA